MWPLAFAIGCNAATTGLLLPCGAKVLRPLFSTCWLPRWSHCNYLNTPHRIPTGTQLAHIASQHKQPDAAGARNRKVNTAQPEKLSSPPPAHTCVVTRLQRPLEPASIVPRGLCDTSAQPSCVCTARRCCRLLWTVVHRRTRRRLAPCARDAKWCEK